MWCTASEPIARRPFKMLIPYCKQVHHDCISQTRAQRRATYVTGGVYVVQWPGLAAPPSRTQPGMSAAQVQRLIGSSQPAWSVYYKARNELAWEWRYCDATSQPARFNVLFDATSHTARSSMNLTENQLSLYGSRGGCWCSE